MRYNLFLAQRLKITSSVTCYGRNYIKINHFGDKQSIGHHSPIANNLQQFHMERDFSPLTHGRNDGLGEVGETSGYNITRGGRLIKPTQKIQDMEWINVRGKGKQGLRGRGNHVH
ncbi:unnamed protein product [Brassica oleracea var. botrytis]